MGCLRFPRSQVSQSSVAASLPLPWWDPMEHGSKMSKMSKMLVFECGTFSSLKKICISKRLSIWVLLMKSCWAWKHTYGTQSQFAFELKFPCWQQGSYQVLDSNLLVPKCIRQWLPTAQKRGKQRKLWPTDPMKLIDSNVRLLITLPAGKTEPNFPGLIVDLFHKPKGLFGVWSTSKVSQVSHLLRRRWVARPSKNENISKVQH